MNQSQTPYYFFFNTASGGQRGQQLLSLNGQQLILEIDGVDKHIYFFNMKDNVSRIQGMSKIVNDKHDIINVVIAGGDGTIMWVIEEMINNQIDVEKCILIPLPFGTGNDFSNSLGWGSSVSGDILGKQYSNLKQFMAKWVHGVESHFDIWDVELELEENGYISEIIQSQNGVLQQKVALAERVFYKKMSNYLSVGVDARIGYGFDKMRTKSRTCNKCVYCWEGIKKMFLKTSTVNDIVEIAECQKELEVQLLFKTAQSEDAHRDSITVPGNPVNLVCLNINSYSGGVQNIWKNAQPQQRQEPYHTPSHSDGQLEFLTFNSIVGLGSERFYSGNATRINQSGGPMKINFRKNISTYFQVDGQYFSVTNPISIKITPCSQLPHGKIKVLQFIQK